MLKSLLCLEDEELKKRNFRFYIKLTQVKTSFNSSVEKLSVLWLLFTFEVLIIVKSALIVNIDFVNETR